MSKFNAFDRIVVYQRRSAWVCDLGSGSALTPRYNTSEDYFDTAGGTKKAIARRRSLVIPVFDEDKIKHLRKMWREGCEVRAILAGRNTNIVWDLDSAMNLVDFGGSPGGVSGANLVLNSDLYVGAIYQSQDLLAGIPWECETATDDGTGTFYFPGPTGWQGAKYAAGSDNAVDETGALSGTGTPTLTMYFPMEGLAFSLSGNFTGSIKTLDHSGATLTTTGKNTADPVTGTIDDGTWQILITVNTASERPALTVTSAGDLASDRVGECVDCSDLTAEAASPPAWSS